MSHCRRFVCAVLTLWSFSAFAWGKEQIFHDATPEELAMKSVEMAPGAQAVILQWDHRQDDYANWESEYVRIKIFDRGAAKYGDVELPYLPHYTWIKDVQARTIHADGTVVPFNGKTYEKLIVKASGVKVMAKTFSLPDIQPGSILEYYYVRAWNPDRLTSTRLVVQRELPVLKEFISMKPYAQTFTSFFAYQSLPEGKKVQKVGDHFELTLENMPAYDDEPYSPPPLTIKPRLDLHYLLGDRDADKYWDKTHEELVDIVEGFIGNRSGIRKEAEDLTRDAATPEQKLSRIYARVQKIRNLSYEVDKTEKEESREKLRDNKNVEDVSRNNYGWRTEINRLFVALARGAGFTANVVRAASRDEIFFARQLPDQDQLDSELALVVVDGKDRFFDPGTPFAPFGIARWEVTDVPGLKIAKKEKATFLSTPPLAPADSLIRRQADLQIDGDVVKGTVKLTYTGEQALVWRLAGRNDDEAKNRKDMEDHVKALLPEGSTAKLKTLGPLKASDEPLVAELDVEMPNLGSFAGSRVLLPLSIFAAAQKNPFTAEQRKHEIYYDYQRQTEDEVVLHVPDGFSVESLPQPTANNLGALRFKAGWSGDGQTVTFKRTMIIDTISVDRQYYAQIRSFYKRAATADQDTVVLKKAAKAASK